VRNLFLNEIPNWHKRLAVGDESWTASTQMLEGHRNLIRAISFSPDGSKLISYSQDGTARLWDAHTGVCQQIIEEDRGQFSPVVFTQSGAILIASWVPYEDTVHIWDISTGTCLHTLDINSNKFDSSKTDSSNVIIARLSPDGCKLASISGHDDLRIWHIGKEVEEHALEGHTGKALNMITFSTNEYMATASLDDNIELCHLGTDCAAKHRYTLRGHKGPVTNIVFSPTNSILASSSTNCAVRLWDMNTGGCQHILEGHATKSDNVTGITSLAFSPDERTLASSSYDCTVRLWDTSTGACLYILQDHSGWVQAVAFSPNGRMLASVGDDYTVQLYDTHTPSSNRVLRGHEREVQTVTFSPDNNTLASGSSDSIIRLWEMNMEHVEYTVSEAHSSLVCAVAFSSDGDLVASASVDCTVRLWDANAGACKQILKGHKGAVETIVFSPDGCILASGSKDCTVRLWDIDTGACRHVLQGSSSKAAGITVVKISPTRPMLASGCRFEHVVRLWNTDTGTCQFILDCLAGVSTVAFSLDGSILASAAWRRIEDLGENGKAASDRDTTIRLWDTSTGTSKLVLESPTVAAAMSFSPEGHRLASASYERSIQLWDTSTGACERTIDNAFVEYPVTNPLLTCFPEHSGQTSNPPLCVYKEWISWRQQDLLWLPPDYRPVSAAVSNGKVALGHSSGRVSFMEFDLTTIARL
jgi:WD40 repeat protein